MIGPTANKGKIGEVKAFYRRLISIGSNISPASTTFLDKILFKSDPFRLMKQLRWSLKSLSAVSATPLNHFVTKVAFEICLLFIVTLIPGLSLSAATIIKC